MIQPAESTDVTSDYEEVGVLLDDGNNLQSGDIRNET